MTTNTDLIKTQIVRRSSKKSVRIGICCLQYSYVTYIKMIAVICNSSFEEHPVPFLDVLCHYLMLEKHFRIILETCFGRCTFEVELD